MKEDDLKALVQLVGQHLRRELAFGLQALTPAMKEQLDRLQSLDARPLNGKKPEISECAPRDA